MPHIEILVKSKGSIMSKFIFIISFSFILQFTACNFGVTLDNLCLYSDSFVVIGTNKHQKQRSESIVVDRYSNNLWLIKHNVNMVLMKDFNNPNICIELRIEDGNFNYLYEDYLFDGKFISRAIIENIPKLVVFDIFTGLYKVIETDISMPYRICGLDNCYIYLYTNGNIIYKINYLTLEKKSVHFDLYNPGYCVEEESFIGINEKNNICIIKDGVRHELPIKGIRYSNNMNYVDISNIYYFINNRIYYAKKDIFGYIKSVFTLSIFLDGLGPIKWYYYDFEIRKSIKLNNSGNTFLCVVK